MFTYSTCSYNGIYYWKACMTTGSYMYILHTYAIGSYSTTCILYQCSTSSYHLASIPSALYRQATANSECNLSLHYPSLQKFYYYPEIICLYILIATEMYCNALMNECQYRNSSLKTRLSDLQKMVSELTVAQREYEDYAHKLEQTTKYILLFIVI